MSSPVEGSLTVRFCNGACLFVFFLTQGTSHIVVTRYRKLKKEVSKKKLVGKAASDAEISRNKGQEGATSLDEHFSDEGDEYAVGTKQIDDRPIVSYWWPNISIAICMDQPNLAVGMPPTVMKREFVEVLIQI